MKNKTISPKILSYLVLGFFVGIFLFVRSFMGLYVFNYRLGELGVLFCFILTSFYVLFIYKKKLLGKSVDSIYLLLIFSFFLILFVSNSWYLYIQIKFIYMDNIVYIRRNLHIREYKFWWNIFKNFQVYFTFSLFSTCFGPSRNQRTSCKFFWYLFR